MEPRESVGLVRERRSLWWDLVTAWASGRRVVLTLEGADVRRLDGYLTAVGSGMASCHMSVDGGDPILVPVAAIGLIRSPHFHEDPPEAPSGAAPVRPVRVEVPDGQFLLVEPLPVSEKARRAMMRAAVNMVGSDLLEVIAAVDRLRRPVTGDVAAILDASVVDVQLWLDELESDRYVERRDGARGSWYVVGRW